MPGQDTAETAAEKASVAAATAKGPKDLDVTLDTSQSKAVAKINPDDPIVGKGRMLHWHSKGNKSFEFTDFDGDSPPFGPPAVSANKIMVKFDPPDKPAGDPTIRSYEYTITVEYDETDVKTESDVKAMSPADGKGVIRN